MNWEKEICELMDKAKFEPDEDFYNLAVEELIEFVEDLVISAYLRGKINGQRQTTKDANL